MTVIYESGGDSINGRYEAQWTLDGRYWYKITRTNSLAWAKVAAIFGRFGTEATRVIDHRPEP